MFKILVYEKFTELDYNKMDIGDSFYVKDDRIDKFYVIDKIINDRLIFIGTCESKDLLVKNRFQLKQDKLIFNINDKNFVINHYNCSKYKLNKMTGENVLSYGLEFQIGNKVIYMNKEIEYQVNNKIFYTYRNISIKYGEKYYIFKDLEGSFEEMWSYFMELAPNNHQKEEMLLCENLFNINENNALKKKVELSNLLVSDKKMMSKRTFDSIFNEFFCEVNGIKVYLNPVTHNYYIFKDNQLMDKSEIDKTTLDIIFYLLKHRIHNNCVIHPITGKIHSKSVKAVFKKRNIKLIKSDIWKECELYQYKYGYWFRSTDYDLIKSVNDEYLVYKALTN